MKRTGFKRPTLERVRSPLIPMNGRSGVIAPVGDVVAAMPKTESVRDERYRRWVASLPCIACGVHGYSQAAHPNAGRGLGQKSDDTDCFPLCCTRPGMLGCHVRHDQLIGVKLKDRRELEKRYTKHTKAKHAALLGLKE